jgi:hypothetical protein
MISLLVGMVLVFGGAIIGFAIGFLIRGCL